MKPKPSHQQNLQELVYSPGRPLTPKTPLFSEAAFAQKSYPGAGGAFKHFAGNQHEEFRVEGNLQDKKDN
jgi:hypothetical protein